MLGLLRPRLVTFDITGTLLMTKLVEHYTEIASEHGIRVTNQRQLARSFKDNFKRLEREHPVFGKHTGLGWENWWKEIVYNVFKDQNSRIGEGTLEKVATNLIECYGTERCWHKYPGVVDILEYLKSRGMVLGVISNFDERLETVLISAGIRNHFSFVLSSYVHGAEKPDPSIFDSALRLAAEAGGVVVKPQEAIHIGDTPENDYAGARAAGWNAILINHDRERRVDETTVPKERQFSNLKQLRQHFETILDASDTRGL